MRKVKNIELMKKFSINLKRCMLEKNITGAKLSQDLGFNKSSVSQWMNGANFPGPDSIKKIASYLNVSISELYGEDEEVKETITYTLPNSINTINDAKSFLRTLNLYNFSDINLDSKTDKEILEIAIALYVILNMSSKL